MRALIMFLLLGSLLLCLAKSAGVSPILLRNLYMSTGKAAAVVWPILAVPAPYYSFTGQNYISVFPHTISTITKVYYTTQSIEYRLVTMQQDTLNPHLQYYLFLQANSNSYIDTRIYSYQNYFVSFTYNYILIYDNNPFINTHLTIDQIYVYSGQTFSNLPSMTTTQSNLTYKYFLSHGYISYQYVNLKNSDNFEFFMTVQGDIFIANQTIKTTLKLPPSISVNGHYGIYFLLIVVDQTALQRDYPAFRYILQSYNTSGSLTIQIWNHMSLEGIQ